MKKLKYWILAVRPWSFSMTFFSVTIGNLLAALENCFSWLIYLLTLSITILIHGGANLINDYFDVKKGIDSLKTATAKCRPHPLLEGKISLASLKKVIIIFYTFSIFLGLLLIYLKGPLVILLGLLGIILSLSYTGPLFNSKYIGLGEIPIFLIWGPLLLSGSYFLQSGRISLDSILISIPVGLLVATVLFSNNIRDIDTDKEKGIKTLAIILGKEKAIKSLSLFIALSYLILTLLIILNILSYISLLVFLSLPFAYKLIKKFYKEIPKDADKITSQFVNLFSFILVISLFLKLLF